MSKDTKHSNVELTDSAIAVTSAEVLETPRQTYGREGPVNDGSLDHEYLELTLSLNAADKYGVAWQLGGLLALRDLQLLKHVRHIDSSGMSNFIICQWIRGCRDFGHLTEPLAWTKKRWGSVCANIEQFVTTEVVERFLTKDQETAALWQRIKQPWNWFTGWEQAFESWFALEWTSGRRLSEAMEYVSIERDQCVSMPVFTMSAYQTKGKRTCVLTTERTPVKTGDDPSGVLPEFIRYDQTDPVSYLIGSAVGTGATLRVSTTDAIDPSVYDQRRTEDQIDSPQTPTPSPPPRTDTKTVRVSIESGLPVDPLVSRVTDVYWMVGREPKTLGLDSGRRIVLDAYTRSGASSVTDVQSAFSEACGNSLKMVPVQTTRESAADWKTPAALYGDGYIQMHLEEEVPLLADSRSKVPTLTSLSSQQTRLLVNWGYCKTMCHFGSFVSDTQTLPYKGLTVDGMF